MPHTYIDRPDQLPDLLGCLAAGTETAIDTEADSLHHYFEKVCLIQLSVDDRHFLVDPLVELDLQPLMAALSGCRLLLHGADYDLRMLRNDFDFRPAEPIFDTMLAAQLCGYDKFGYGPLVEQITGVVLGKGDQRSDWSRRPLTDQQIAYAVDDTRYLPTVAEHCRQELDRLDRLAWHAESCAALVGSTASDRERDPDRLWRIKGARDLDRQGLAYLRGVWHWREDEARRWDRPPFMVMGNKQLLELAQLAAQLNGELDWDRVRLPRNCRGRRLAALKSAVKEARLLPRDEWPTHPQPTGTPLTPEEKGEVKRLRRQIARVAEELQLDASLICPRAAAEAIVRRGALSKDDFVAAGLLNWQAALVERASGE